MKLNLEDLNKESCLIGATRREAAEESQNEVNLESKKETNDIQQVKRLKNFL